MAERLDEGTAEWPLRPWIMAAICSAAGLIFHLLIDYTYPESLSVTRQAAAAFVAVGTISFVLTAERLRLPWALAFAVAWGAVIAFVGWFTAGYNREGEIVEFPFLAGIFAVMLAAPLFQTVRDEGAWRFPYRRLHSHAWTDAVIGAASLFFTGVSFLLAWLIAGLFDLIGIDLLKDLLEEEWFAWMLAGFAFGAAAGLLRERDKLVAILQRLVMIVFSVLAPVLAVALVLFLVSTPFTGLDGLWNSWVSAAALLLAASGGAILLANAVIGDGRDDRSPSRVLHWSALALVAVVLPLAAIAGFAMSIRIGEYGWTPERIWGAVAVGVAIAYGLGGWWAIWRGRRDFDEPLRPLQTRLAIGLCGLALLLALPILDFGAISARSQLARLESGRIEPDKFDWAAMAFDFGPAGRARLAQLARSGPAAWKDRARAALDTRNRYGLEEQTRAAIEADQVAGRLRLVGDVQLTEALRRRIAARGWCDADSDCAAIKVDDTRVLVLSASKRDGFLVTQVVDLTEPLERDFVSPSAPPTKVDDLGTARIELREVRRRQLFVNGQPLDEVTE